MAWTDVSTGDKVEAAHINDIHQALNGTVGKAQPMAFTEVDESATYALDVRNKDATNSLIARFRNAANEVVLSVVKETVNTAKQIVSTVATGTAPFVVNSTTKVDNLHVARATLADTVAGDSIDGDAIADDAVDSEHIAAGAIDLAHMSANSVDSDQYVDGSIDEAHIANNAVGNAQFRQSAGVSVVGRSANSTGNVADISAGANDRLLARVSNALSWVQLTLGMIPDALITGAKMVADVTLTRLALTDYLIVHGFLNHRSHIRVLNKAESGYLAWAERSVSGAEAVINLNNMGTVDGVDVSAHNHVGGAGQPVAAGGLANGAVDTTARLANDIVDDTKVGNRVPQFYRRQGGSATDWSAAGTTNRTPGAVRMQAGSTTSTPLGTMSVTFPVAFSQIPLVFLTAYHPDSDYAVVSAITATGFEGYTYQYIGSPSAGIVVHWLAIGPE